MESDIVMTSQSAKRAKYERERDSRFTLPRKRDSTQKKRGAKMSEDGG